MSPSRITHALAVLHRKHEAFFGLRRRPKKRLSMSTRQWLVLTFSVAALVGVIFVLTLYYSTAR